MCFLGYATDYKGYKVLDLDTNQIFVSRNVTFHETIYLFKTRTHSDDHDSLFPATILPMFVPVSLDSDASSLPVHTGHIPSNAVPVNLQPSTVSGPQDAVTSDTGHASLPSTRAKR